MKLETPNMNTLQSYKLFTVFKAGNFRLEYTFIYHLLQVLKLETSNIPACFLGSAQTNKAQVYGDMLK